MKNRYALFLLYRSLRRLISKLVTNSFTKYCEENSFDRRKLSHKQVTNRGKRSRKYYLYTTLKEAELNVRLNKPLFVSFLKLYRS